MILVAKEKFIYFWDYGSYWYKSLNYTKYLFSNSKDALKSLYVSINFIEYNDLACVLLSLTLKFLGNSYYAFVMINVCFFYIPNAFLMSFAINKICNKFNLYLPKFIFMYTYMLLFSVALIPVLNGYVDIVGMLPLSLMYILVIDRDFEKIEIKKRFNIRFFIVVGIIFKEILCVCNCWWNNFYYFLLDDI